MNEWTTLADVRTRLLREWNRGRLLVSAKVESNRSRTKRRSKANSSGDPATRSASKALSNASTCVSIVARVVAMRAPPTKRAISPKNSPSESRATSWGTSTTISPDATTYKASPSSPWAKRICPGDSLTRVTRSMATRRRSSLSTEKKGVFGNTIRAMVRGPADRDDREETRDGSTKSRGISIAPRVPTLVSSADCRAPGIKWDS